MVPLGTNIKRLILEIRAGTLYRVTFETNPCKDNFDRGGAQNIVTDLLRLIMLYEDVDMVPSAELKKTIFSIIAPPAIGKGKKAIMKRIAPALKVSEILANLKKEQIQELKAFFKEHASGWEISKFNSKTKD